MIGWIIGGGYALGYVSVWRTVAYFIARDLSYLPDNRVEGEAVLIGCAIATMASFLWPLIMIGIAIRKVYALRGREIDALIVPRGEKRRLSKATLARRIRELEQEMNIR